MWSTDRHAATGRGGRHRRRGARRRGQLHRHRRRLFLRRVRKLLGQALKTWRRAHDVVIATKVFGPMGDGPNDRGASRGHIMDASRPAWSGSDRPHRPLPDPRHRLVTPIEETLRALDDLVHQGLVRYIGVSNWQAWRIMKALGISERARLRGSTPCRPTTPSPAATWSASRPAAERGAARPDGLEPARRRPARRQVRPRRATAGGRAAGQLRFPAGRRRPRLGLRRRHARDRRGARRFGGAGRAGLAARQAPRHQRDHRRQARASNWPTTWPRQRSRSAPGRSPGSTR